MGQSVMLLEVAWRVGQDGLGKEPGDEHCSLGKASVQVVMNLEFSKEQNRRPV